jgi:hypothetical protein
LRKRLDFVGPEVFLEFNKSPSHSLCFPKNPFFRYQLCFHKAKGLVEQWILEGGLAKCVEPSRNLRCKSFLSKYKVRAMKEVLDLGGH